MQELSCLLINFPSSGLSRVGKFQTHLSVLGERKLQKAALASSSWFQVLRLSLYERTSPCTCTDSVFCMNLSYKCSSILHQPKANCELGPNPGFQPLGLPLPHSQGIKQMDERAVGCQLKAEQNPLIKKKSTRNSLFLPKTCWNINWKHTLQGLLQ